MAGWISSYENRENNYQMVVGGGVEKRLLHDTKISGGIYYDYLKNNNNFLFRTFYAPELFDMDQTKYPDEVEHQVILRLAGEKNLSPIVIMRSGLEVFWGRVSKDYEALANWPERESVDGPHWGIRFSLGGTVKLEKFDVEPFWGFGYQKWNLDGTGSIVPSPLGNFIRMDEERKDWLTSLGFSVKF